MTAAPSPLSSDPRPLVPSGLLGTAIFVATEAMFFAALISAYLVLRAQDPAWPPLDQPRLPVEVTGVNTLVLLASGYTMIRALGRVSREATVRRLQATAALGALFLVVQGSEWLRLVRYGLTATSSLYAATFYTLVGAHGIHVLAALVVLVSVTLRARGGAYTADRTGLAMCQMYWLFVVAVWPVLYGLLYLS